MRNISDELLKELETKGRLSVSEAAGRYFFTKLTGTSRKMIEGIVASEPLLGLDGDYIVIRKSEPYDLETEISAAKFAFIDTETNFNNMRAVEIGIVLSDGPQETGRFSTLLNPVVGVDRETLELTGIREEDIRRAPRFEEAWGNIEPLLRGRGIAAHNLPFDRRVIAEELGIAGMRFGGDAPGICTLQFARALLKRGQCSLDELSERFDLREEGRHRALPDAGLCFKLFFRLVKYAEENKVVETSRLSHLAQFKALFPKLAF